MQKRQLGSSELEVSAIGLGGHQLVTHRNADPPYLARQLFASLGSVPGAAMRDLQVLPHAENANAMLFRPMKAMVYIRKAPVMIEPIAAAGSLVIA